MTSLLDGVSLLCCCLYLILVDFSVSILTVENSLFLSKFIASDKTVVLNVYGLKACTA